MAHGVYMTEHQHPSKLINDSVIYKLSTKQLGDFRILYFLGCTESEGLESAGLNTRAHINVNEYKCIQRCCASAIVL